MDDNPKSLRRRDYRTLHWKINSPRKALTMKKNSIFVASYISSRIMFCLLVAGIFYTCATTIQGSVPPCRCLMARLLCWSVGQRERQSPFLFLPVKHSLKMSKTPAECLNGKGMPNSNRRAHDTSKSIYSKFLIEKNAKNKCYAFILSRGLLSEFTEFSRTYQNEGESLSGRIALTSKIL